MAFLEGVPIPEGARGFIPQLIRAGYSQRGALSFLRANGVAVRDATFRSAWGEIAADLASRPALAGIDLTAPLAQQGMPTWRAGREGQFGYQVNVVVRNRPTGIVTTKTQYTFSGANISPQDAIDAVYQDYETGAQTPGYENVVVAAYFVQGFQMLGRGGL